MKYWHKKRFIAGILVCSLCVLTACSSTADNTSLELNAEQKEASTYTAEINESVYATLDFDNEEELECAKKGLIAAPEKLEITDEEGKVIWSQEAYAFVNDSEAPDSVNPSLWRNTQLNNIYGLFEVTDGIYQVRGYDMTNMTFIKGDTGWIVFDPLMSVECSKAAMQLVNEHLGEYPVKAIVISHPHADHYGGVKGIVTVEQVKSGEVPIIVPDGFEESAISENVYAGVAMARRASYQYGIFLDGDEKGTMAMGIGMGQSTGTTSYISPTDIIKETGETRVIDGVKMEFQMTPGTEAPAEMNTWFEDKNALWLAENCTGTLHNLYTLRGAQVRDGNAWANYIMEAITLYGDKVEVAFQSHNWPHWENEKIVKYMEDTAAVYKFINDQTLMYINQGYTETEIANMIELPEDLAKNWYTRQYYGTVAHNAKAVYQKYMGWYDANPIHLAELEPSESAKKYVEYMGSADEVLKKAKADFDNGEYQWVAEITNVLVYADPENKEARYLCADALEQLGYQAESGTWRNAYLTGAKELREGTTTDESLMAHGSTDTRTEMSPEMMLDYIGICLNTNKAQDLNFKVNLEISDLEEKYLLTIKSGVLLYQKDASAEDADATWVTPKLGLFTILSKDVEQQKEMIKVTGDTSIMDKLTENIETFPRLFNIVEP